MFRLEEIADELQALASGVEPREFTSRDAAHLAEIAAKVERLGAACKILFARRAVDGNGWRSGNDAIVPEQWFARLSGCSESEARRSLKMGERLVALPVTEGKLRDGSLSLAQASICAEGATADPGAEPKLLSIAAKGEMRRLREVKERVVTAATDETEARRRAHRERSLRTWTHGLSTHGSFQGPTEEVAVLLAAIEPLKRKAFTAARKAEQFETPDAYRFDGLIELGRRALRVGGDTAAADSVPVTRLRVDLSRLLDHDDAPGEVCEIPGVGPVPVAHARQVLPHGLLELVISDGVEVRTVVSKTRHVPEALKIAIEERDQTCKVEGCDRTDHLERHHVEEYAPNHLTTYELLGRLCELHHDLVTYKGYTVERNPDGSWRLRPPDERRDTDAA
jgi:hypothetical protein